MIYQMQMCIEYNFLVKRSLIVHDCRKIDLVVKYLSCFHSNIRYSIQESVFLAVCHRFHIGNVICLSPLQTACYMK